jgi:DNA-directed RNA polymerase subunit H (RpoH/RPB5)
MDASVKRMLNVRQVPGDDVNVLAELESLAPHWAFQRGNTVLVCGVDVLGSDAVARLKNFTEARALDRCIVVYNVKCTAQARKDLAASDQVAFESFSSNEMALSPLDWSVQSQYRLLTTPPSEPTVNLPRIWITDPVARYYGASIGDVFEIVNTWGTLPPETTHRVVSAPVGA